MKQETFTLTRKQMESLVSSYYKLENLILFFNNANIDNVISINPHFYDYLNFKDGHPPAYEFFAELKCVFDNLEAIVCKD